MSDDADWVRDFLSLLRGLHQDQVIAQSELALLDTADLPRIPMPNGAHPSLARYADAVRNASKPPFSICIPRMHRATLAEPDFDSPSAALGVDRVVMTPQKIMAPAPFVARWVGDEARYVWRAWSDGSSRYITSDAELVWRP